MKNRKLIKFLALALILTVVACIFCACGGENAVVSIQKTASNGLTDTYTITYSDGTTSEFSVTNGKNGNDGENLDARQLFEIWLESNPNGTYEQFLATIAPAGDSNATVVSRLLLSCGKVYSEFTEQVIVNRYPFGGTVTTYQKQIFCGSAVIYNVTDEYTYLITNYHVVYDKNAYTQSKLAEKITIYLYGSEDAPVATSQTDTNGCKVYDYGVYGIDCSYVGGCASADLAVLKVSTSAIKAINSDIRAVTFAQNYTVGQTAIAIGNPENEGISVTEGVVSVDNEYISLAVDGTTRYHRSIRVDTAIYSGSSGGGLFDSSGNLIGVTNAGDNQDQNVNYAIPVDIVKAVVENICHYQDGKAKSFVLGVSVNSKNVKYVYDAQNSCGKIVEEVEVSEVAENSIIKSLGVQVGDKITAVKINDTTHDITRKFQIGDLMYTVRAGDVVSVVYKRGGEQAQSASHTVLESELSAVN